MASFGYSGVDFLGDGCALDDADVAGFFAGGVEAVGDVLFGAVCVFDDFGGGEGFGFVFIFGPVGAAKEKVLVICS